MLYYIYVCIILYHIYIFTLLYYLYIYIYITHTHRRGEPGAPGPLRRPLLPVPGDAVDIYIAIYIYIYIERER